MNSALPIFLFCLIAHTVSAQLIITGPSNQTICNGEMAMFSCTVSPEADEFKWEHSENNLTWNEINDGPVYDDTETPILQILNTTGLNNDFFRLVATDSDPNPDTTQTSVAAQLIVNPLPVATITSSNSPICSGETRVLTGTPGGGSFAIISGPGTINMNTLTSTGMGTIVIQYSVTQNGCTNSDSQNIISNTTPVAEITSSGASMCSGEMRTLTGMPSGGVFSVSSGPGTINGNTLTATGMGTIVVQYNVTQNGCSDNITQNIISNNTPAAQITSSGASMCSGEMRTLTGMPTGGVFTVSSGPGTINGNTLTATGMGTIVVQYNVTQNGCNDNITQNITSNTTPTATITSDDSPICTGGMRILTGAPTGGVFSIVSGPATLNGNTLTATGGGTISIEYSVTQTSCTDNASQSIISNDTLVTTITSDNSPICSGQSRILSGTPVGGTFVVLSGPGTIVGNMLSSNGPGNIVVQYTVTQNNCSGSSSQVIPSNQTPIASITSDNSPLCSGQTRILMGSPAGGTFLVQSGPGTINGNILTSTGAGTIIINYAVTENGCTDNEMQSITSNLTVATFTSSNSMICSGDTRVLTANPGGGSFSVQSGPGTINGNILTSTGAGTIALIYTVTQNGCVGTTTQSIISQPTPNATITSSATPLCTGTQRILTGTPIGGTFSIVSGPGVLNGNILTTTSSGMVAIRYTVTQNGCPDDTTQNIQSNQTPNAMLTSASSPMCVNEMRMLTGVPAGGIFSVVNGPGTINGAILTVTGSGNISFHYRVSQNNCPDTVVSSIISYPNPALEVLRLENSGQSANDGKICSKAQLTLTASGADAYKWHDNSEESMLVIFPDFEDGNYQYSVTGSKTYESVKTCSTLQSGSIEVFDNPSAEYEIETFGGGFRPNSDIRISDNSLPGTQRTINKWQWDLDNVSLVIPNTFDPSEYFEFIESFVIQYSDLGIKNIALTVTNDRQCQSTTESTFSIQDTLGPIVDLNIVGDNTCQGEITLMTDKSRPRDDNSTLVAWRLIIAGGEIVYPSQYTGMSEIEYASRIDTFRILWTDPGSQGAELFVTQKRTSTGEERSNSAEDGIEIDLLPTVDIIVDKGFYCEGDTVQITFQGTPTSFISYTINGLPGTQQANLPFSRIIDTELNIRVESVALLTCINPIVISSDIVARAKPEITIVQGDNVLVCQNEQFDLSLSETADTISWYVNSSFLGSTETINVNTTNTTTSTYSVTGTSNGCSSTDSITVEVVSPPNPDIIGDMEVCIGQVVRYDAQNIGSGTLSWSVSNGSEELEDNGSWALIKWNAPGIVTLTESITTCSTEKHLSVTVSSTASSPEYHHLVYLTGGGILLYPNPDHEPNLCYQWYHNDLPLQGDTFQGLVIGTGKTAMERAEYKVDVFFCDDSARECKQEIRGRSSVVHEEQHTFAIHAAPNPNSGLFDLHITAPEQGTYQISAYNLIGHSVLQDEADLNTGLNTIPINLSDVPAGLYYLRLQNMITQESIRIAISIID